MKGALAIALAARKHKIRGLILPAANGARKAAVVAGLEVLPRAASARGGGFSRRHLGDRAGGDRPQRDPRRVRRGRCRLRRL
ncbi:MAG: hypothetical protein WDO13_18340 [Verrucomicrobiota bacterium]